MSSTRPLTRNQDHDTCDCCSFKRRKKQKEDTWEPRGSQVGHQDCQVQGQEGEKNHKTPSYLQPLGVQIHHGPEDKARP